MHILSKVIGCLYAVTISHLNLSMQQLPDDYTKNLQTCSPRIFATLKKKKLCQTYCENKNLGSSRYYRALLFEALKNCQHPKPEIVMLLNDSNDHAACAFKNDTYGICVNFDEKGDWAQESYGTQRMVMHHEAAHIIEQHYNTINTLIEQQDEERMADKLAVAACKCFQCSRDFAQYFLKEHAQKNHSDTLLKKHRKITLRHIDSMPKKEITKLIHDTSKISRKRKSTHPIDLERALKIHKYSLDLNGVLCAYHQKNSIEK